MPIRSFSKVFNMNISIITKCYKHEPSLRNSTWCSILRNGNLKLIRAPANEIFQCHDLKGLTLVTTSKLGLNIFLRCFKSYLWLHGHMLRCENYISFFSVISLIQCWTMDTPEQYKSNWERYPVVSYFMAWAFQRWTKLADLKCNYWPCIVYKKNS